MVGGILEKWFLNMGIAFLLRQFAKFKNGIDWPKVKEDLALRVKNLVPGEWLDADAVALCNALIDAVSSVLSANEDIERVLKLLYEQKWNDAWMVIRDLIMKQWQPQTKVEKKVMNYVHELHM